MWAVCCGLEQYQGIAFKKFGKLSVIAASQQSRPRLVLKPRDPAAAAKLEQERQTHAAKKVSGKAGRPFEGSLPYRVLL